MVTDQAAIPEELQVQACQHAPHLIAAARAAAALGGATYSVEIEGLVRDRTTLVTLIVETHNNEPMLLTILVSSWSAAERDDTESADGMAARRRREAIYVQHAKSLARRLGETMDVKPDADGRLSIPI